MSIETLLTILDNVPFHIDHTLLAEKLRVKANSSYAVQLRQLATQAEEVARPKAVYGISFVEGRGEDWVTLDGFRFTSRILRINLKGVHRVFPYVATCGVELDEWSQGIDDILLSFWADTIKEMALRAVVDAMDAHLENQFHPGSLSSMNPGSLGDFPLAAQSPLFALLGDVEEMIGVRLTSDYLMLPTKTVSGLYFPTEAHFSSCQLCPRQNCPSRRAPYDAQLYETRYSENIM
jgi:hypothetical protein